MTSTHTTHNTCLQGQALATPSHGKSLVQTHGHVDTWVVSCRYNRLVGQNATSLSRRFTRLHGLQPLLLTELTAMDMARKASLTTLTTLAHRCTIVTQAFVDQVLCRLLIIKLFVTLSPSMRAAWSEHVSKCVHVHLRPLSSFSCCCGPSVVLCAGVDDDASGTIAPHTWRNGL